MITVPFFILVCISLIGAVVGFFFGAWMVTANCEDRLREMGRQVEVFRQRWVKATSKEGEDVDPQ